MVSKYKRLTLSVVIAFVIVIVVFVVGSFYDSSKISYLSQNLQTYENNINELELATLLSSTNSSFSCGVLTDSLQQIGNEMQSLGQELSESKLASSIVNYSQLNDQYTYVRVEYWLLANKINLICGNKLVTVMFIYSTTGNNNVVEGDELSYLSFKNDSLVVSAIDGNLDLPLVSILLKSYNITNNSMPALIINSNYVEKGYLNTSQIKNLICKDVHCINFSS
jgi:hypothetical protein